MEREDKRVAQLWGGRFTKETDKLVYNFNASISFDQKFYKQDMEGSIAHVKMLGKQGILTEKEMQDIVDCLKEILKEVEEGKLIITDEYEDIHSFVEAKLIDRLGDTGKKLHTGRSRNDQVALDMRLYTRQEVLHTDKLVKELLETILKIMEEIPRRLCQDLPIFRKHSRLHWHIIWELILRCSAVTDSACRIFFRE